MTQGGIQTDCARLEALNLPGFEGQLYIQRDDLIHPIVSGNKWRKLKHVIKKAGAEGKTRLVTFGGAYSNHMVATACAGAVCGLRTSCFIRADEALHNHYLAAARLYGMELIPVSREAYRSKETLFQEHFGQDETALYVAEGGASPEAEAGVAEIIHEMQAAPDLIVHASATATTAAGLGNGIREKGWHTKVLSIAVLKNGEEQRRHIEIAGLQDIVTVNDEFTLGGYAKTTPELMNFIRQTVAATGIMLDPVYTGKALYALQQLKPEGRVVYLHTGGTLGIFSDAYMKLI